MRLLSEGEARRIVGPHFGGLFDTVAGAWSEYGTEYSATQRAKHCQVTRASIVHDLMVARAADYFTRIPTSRVLDIRGMKVFTLEDGRNQVAIRFKKFDRHLLSRNQPTEQVEAFRGQRQLVEVGAAFHLEAGYMLDRQEINIEQVSLVCPNGPDVFWDIELNPAAAPVAKVHDIFESRDVDENVNIVRPREDQKDETQKPVENEPKA
jgi:hypothetical protein